MPDEYINIPVEFDETALYNTAVATIQVDFPEWEPVAGSLVDIQLRCCASMAAVAAEMASTVPFNIFKAFLNWAGQVSQPAVPAEVVIRFTAKDDIGYTIPALTPIGLTSASTSDPVAFQTGNEVDIPATYTFVDTICTAILPGSAGNDLDEVIRADSLGFVTSITIAPSNEASHSGQDAETDDAFVNRGSQELETWSKTPILGRDFALLAREIPGVIRCAWIDNFDYPTKTAGVERVITLCPIDANGQGFPTDILDEVMSLMESMRELNFVCYAVSPDYANIDITADVYCQDPTALTSAESQATDALNQYLSPATWGTPTTGRGQMVPLWINQPWIRYSRIMKAIEDCVDVDYVENVTINGVAADFQMTGTFPLPSLQSAQLNMLTSPP
jgi:hypothetical protein